VTYKGLTIERHEALGRELKTVQSTVNRLGVLLSNVYGVRSRSTVAVIRFDAKLGLLRSALDDKVFSEKHDAPGYPQTHVYYGDFYNHGTTIELPEIPRNTKRRRQPLEYTVHLEVSDVLKKIDCAMNHASQIIHNAYPVKDSACKLIDRLSGGGKEWSALLIALDHELHTDGHDTTGVYLGWSNV
jgi:hypothetical protein